MERQKMDVDIVCVGFGPAMGGFLTTLSRGLLKDDGTPAVESAVAPGMPPQVVCYERADGIGFGVSGVVSRARAIRATFPDLDSDEDASHLPMCTAVNREELVYLLDPVGASRRPWPLRIADRIIRLFGMLLPYRDHALRLPYVPPFLSKEGGLAFSLGAFNSWVGEKLAASAVVQIWPGMPVAAPIFEENRVAGVRLADQGVDRRGEPAAGYMPGMDIHAKLTVVGDGPVGPVGRQIDARVGMPKGHHRREWAAGAKMVVALREDSGLKAGTVIHTFGYPEPGIFGFLYVYSDNAASLGIFVPSWLDDPVRSSYRYLQHWMTHPYLWKHLAGGKMRSWGAKSLLESGRRGEPYLAGDGYARIGEGSGSTNVLSGSGVDEAWVTGVQLAEGVLDLAKEGRPFTKDNLERAYVRRRRSSWVDREARTAARSRDGFCSGFLGGMLGMGLAGFTRGLLFFPGKSVPPHSRLPSVEEYYRGRIPAGEIAKIRNECWEKGEPLHDALMERAGWPRIPYDGKLLVSHQDALLVGGKVQAVAGFADHVAFADRTVCARCGNKVCVEMCSGQAITPGEGGVPAFDREKCVHCGACLWNCSQPRAGDPELANIEFRAGSGGLHSGEN